MESASYRFEFYSENSLSLFHYPKFSVAKNFIHNRTIHKAIEIVCVYDGKLDCWVNGAHKILEKGDYVFANSYDNHDYETAPEASTFVIMVSPDLLNDVLSKGVEFVNFFTPSPSSFEKSLLLLKEADRNFDHMNFYQKKGFLLNFIGTLYDEKLLQGEAKNGKRDIIGDILEYIQEHYMEKLTLQTVAERFGYSRNYFSTLFNKLMGSNFVTYLNWVRFTKVSEEKSKGEKGRKMEDIILASGFGSAETYYRVAKQFEGKKNS